MKLAVLVPIHNEAECIPLFIPRISAVLKQLRGISEWELIFIDDGSSDNSLELIRSMHQVEPRIKALSLSRNFGYQAALVAGLTEVSADLYAIIDVDCEDPPELLNEFMIGIESGCDVAYGVRSNRLEPGFVTWLRHCFYRLNWLLSDTEVIIWMAEFGMYTRNVRDAILKSHTTFPFLRTEIASVGFKRHAVQYQRQARIAGKSHYRLLSMTKFAIAGILAGTTLPLRINVYITPFFALAFFIGVIVYRSMEHVAYLAMILCFLYVLFAVPWLSLYIARDYKNLVQRPVYVVHKQKTFL